MFMLSESWRVVHTDYHYALIYICRRSTAEAEYCAYDTLLVIGRPGALVLNSDELAEYFRLTLTSQCLAAANQLDIVTNSGKVLQRVVMFGYHFFDFDTISIQYLCRHICFVFLCCIMFFFVANKFDLI